MNPDLLRELQKATRRLKVLTCSIDNLNRSIDELNGFRRVDDSTIIYAKVTHPTHFPDGISFPITAGFLRGVIEKQRDELVENRKHMEAPIQKIIDACKESQEPWIGIPDGDDEL